MEACGCFDHRAEVTAVATGGEACKMHRVVIVGGGVGGLVTATHPARRLSGSDKAVGLSVDANRGFRIDPGFVKRTRSLCAPLGELSDESYS